MKMVPTRQIVRGFQFNLDGYPAHYYDENPIAFIWFDRNPNQLPLADTVEESIRLWRLTGEIQT